MRKYSSLMLFGLLFPSLLSGCNKAKEEDNPAVEESFSKCEIIPVDYGVSKKLETEEDIVDFMIPINTDNKPSEEGVVVSPYFSSLELNGISVPVYAARTTNTIHSFAYVDIEKEESDKRVNIDVTIKCSSFKKSFSKVEVLPLSKGVTATKSGKTVSAKIHDVGNYSFVFNGKQDQPLTIMVSYKDHKENYLTGEITRSLVEINPGEYFGSTQLSLADQNTVYFFKKGEYKIGSLTVPSGSVLYFEEGAYLMLNPDNLSPITTNNVNNVAIKGHGLIDYSQCNGSQLNTSKDPTPGKGGLSINGGTEININGLMIINAQTWQCCINFSKDIYISNCMFFGYRTYADGIMLNNCQDAIVEHNFIRTGDDAFETKSTSGSQLTKNVVFQYNSAWTDKAVAYGCIYESKFNTSDVHFLHNSVGFASGNWSRHLGCAVIQLGNNPEATMYDIEFDDMEIYYSCNQALCNIYIGGSGGMGAGSGTAKDIYFKNIKCEQNVGYMLNLQTWDNENCFIKKVYMENIVSNNIRLTADNFRDYCDFSKVVGGYSVSNLTIDGVKCK